MKCKKNQKNPEIVHKINELPNTTLAIDIPSGLMGEDNSLGRLPAKARVTTYDNIICSDYTLTLQFPKMSFLFAENEKYVGECEVLPIRLHPKGIARTPSKMFLIEKEEIKQIFQKRSKFANTCLLLWKIRIQH